MNEIYDIIVVGGGHAGCEAAHAAAQLGAKVLLITIDMTKMAQMSCNPAMGGIAKGQIIREIDALGGISGIVTDKSMVQFRMLNKSKGPAVWSPRAQCDRTMFTLEWRKILETNSNIDFWQDSVIDLIIEDAKVRGIRTRLNATFYSETVILTIGTFENGLIHVGRSNIGGGRISEPNSYGISDKLKKHDILSGRLKTGTPARIDGRTINFQLLEEQKGDDIIQGFSFLPIKLPQRQLSCFITYTNSAVHNILQKGFKDSPLYTGIIKGTGPRYCPSIEDKIVTFAQRETHQLFLEPEGWSTQEYYINGFSSSLPLEIQYKAIRNIKGLENCKIFRPGYAIEYDYYPPTQLKQNLESRNIKNLFFAGQINGTTGYEEAASQGLIAGINAVMNLRNKEPFILNRDEAYIGVLIDDLITKGIDEPYRMFTSRAEYRILLRQDNADTRLTQKSIEIGLANDERKRLFIEKVKAKQKIIDAINTISITPVYINSILEQKNESKIKQKVKLKDILMRTNIQINDIINFVNIEDIGKFITNRELLESIEIEFKYNGYIERDRTLARKIERLNDIKIDKGIDYNMLHSISTEAKQKLKKYKPETIGQAARISGISPSDISILLVYIGR